MKKLIILFLLASCLAATSCVQMCGIPSIVSMSETADPYQIKYYDVNNGAKYVGFEKLKTGVHGEPLYAYYNSEAWVVLVPPYVEYGDVATNKWSLCYGEPGNDHTGLGERGYLTNSGNWCYGNYRTTNGGDLGTFSSVAPTPVPTNGVPFDISKLYLRATDNSLGVFNRITSGALYGDYYTSNAFGMEIWLLSKGRTFGPITNSTYPSMVSSNVPGSPGWQLIAQGRSYGSLVDQSYAFLGVPGITWIDSTNVPFYRVDNVNTNIVYFRGTNGVEYASDPMAEPGNYTFSGTNNPAAGPLALQLSTGPGNGSYLYVNDGEGMSYYVANQHSAYGSYWGDPVVGYYAKAGEADSIFPDPVVIYFKPY